MAKQLLFSVTRADCEWQTFTVGGHGGSGKDTSNSGVRCIHRASGAVGECRDNRQQHLNRQIAFRRMAETQKFKIWHNLEVARRHGRDIRTIEERVDEQMQPQNLKIEEYSVSETQPEGFEHNDDCSVFPCVWVKK